MTFDSITNRAEFFSDHYLDARLAADLTQLREAWDTAEGRGLHTARAGLRGIGSSYFSARALAVEAGPTEYVTAVRALNDVVLTALGFTPARTAVTLPRSDGTDELVTVMATQIETSTGLLLVAIDAGLATEIDQLFDTSRQEDDRSGPGMLLDPLSRDREHVHIAAAADAPGELFSLDDPPRFVLLCGGTSLLLAERAKWAEGRFLAVDLDAALGRADASARGELETIAALFSADALVAGRLDEEETATSYFDQVDDRSTRHAVGVSKELREGMRRSVEILANEVIQQRLSQRLGVYEGENRVDPGALTRQCLRYLYRLIVLLYAESRPELGVLPTDDDAYLAGYSFDRLRELVLVELDDDHARNGTHIGESLRLLFGLVNDGYHAEHTEQEIVFGSSLPVDERARSIEEYLQFPGLDATIFDAGSTPLLDSVPLRNEALQKVLALLMLNRKSKKKGDQRGFVSYAHLGINQLGAVYEGLMAYTGFFAKEDLFEVAKDGDSSAGTWMVPVDQAAEYPEKVFVTFTDPLTDRIDRVRHSRGDFVYRLSGRDRQRSASYYTPEVLTSCVVRHALAELLGTDDRARVPGGSAGISEARGILDLTICEPALGSGSFLNEAISQLSAEYLKRRQAELGETLDADRYQRELQKVKAHFALHQSYGVDLNATAVELAEVSLWLNCMYPGLKAPWFGLRLRRGNSLVGARRATWRSNQLKTRVWAKDKVADSVPPIDRPLGTSLDPDEIHHFLLPGHGWAGSSSRKEAKELAGGKAKVIGEWRKTILKEPSAKDADRLCALAAGVERLWSEATDVLHRLNERMRRQLGLYGTDVENDTAADDRRKAESILGNPESALGRLRLVMDAWVGFWFWKLDSDIPPPSWPEWLAALEEVVGPEPLEPVGQLDLFADLAAIQEVEERRARGRASVGATLERYPWMARARDLAQGEGAWHWELEFAPILREGGFDLQVGNPPWVRPIWKDDLVLAEWDPWWGVTEKAPEKDRDDRRTHDLAQPDYVEKYLAEVAAHEGLAGFLASVQLWPVLAGVQPNLFMSFMETAWRHSRPSGSTGMLHPESHFVDPAAGELRSRAYKRLRRHFNFINELMLFEEVGHPQSYGIHVYASPSDPSFLQISRLFHPATVEGSFDHDGSGELPGVQYPAGGWDLRPHRDRIIVVDVDALTDGARLFDDPGAPPDRARLLRPVLLQELGALSALAAHPVRLADRPYFWTAGWHEKGAKTDGYIKWETAIQSTWDEVILQGPHFTVATPFAKQPNENCRSKGDWSEWDLESLPDHLIPRTNYQRACGRDEYESGVAHWKGKPNTSFWRAAYREMVDAGNERSLRTALMPPGPANVGTVILMSMGEAHLTAAWVGLLSSLPYDYFVKVANTDHLKDYIARRMPVPFPHRLEGALLLRTLRLNCLTADFSPLWRELFEPSWRQDRWTDSALSRVELGSVETDWSQGTPLRRDLERRLALVETDAIAALMLGLSAEQLCAMYRTQFAVLRKYEYAMVFDSEGRKICAHHQSAGFRQAQLQKEASEGRRPVGWKSVWKLYEAYAEAPSLVDWEREYTPPFARPDREAEMTRAYNEFQRRLDAGEYG